MKQLTRREALKNVGLTLGGLAFGTQTLANNKNSAVPLEFAPPQYAPLLNPVTAITLGAGNRGNVYGGFSLAASTELDIIGVAEPIQIRSERYAKKHNIEAKNCFKTWEDVFKVPKFADAAPIFATAPLPKSTDANHATYIC